MELRKRKPANGPSRRKNDTVGWYLDQIKDVDVLPHERVVELFKEYEAGSKKAMDELVKRNLKLVVAVARAYRDKGVDWEDLLQEGNGGLIHAVEKFDWRRGNRFSTYATWWIRQRISHFLSTQRHSIRVPTHAMRLKKHIEKTLEEMRENGGGEEPSWERVAEVVGSSADVVEATVAGSRATLSLSASSDVAGDNDRLLKRVSAESDPRGDPEAPLARAQLRDALRACVDAMEPLDRTIVEIRLSAVADGGKLVLAEDISDELARRGNPMATNAVRARLRRAMRLLAEETCRAMGEEVDEDALDRASASRQFQEAAAHALAAPTI